MADELSTSAPGRQRLTSCRRSPRCAPGPRRSAPASWRRPRRPRASDGERRAVESITAAIVNKLLHLPTVRMKEAAAAADGVTYVEAVEHLFGLGDDDGSQGRLPREVGSRSPRPSRRPRSSAGLASRSRSYRSRRRVTATERSRSASSAPGSVRQGARRGAALAASTSPCTAKDMTSTDTEGLAVGAYRPGTTCATRLRRRPFWAGMRGHGFHTAPRAQLLALEPGLVIEPLRATSTRACANAVSVDWT